MTRESPVPLKRQQSKVSNRSSVSAHGQKNTAKTKTRHASTVSQPNMKQEKKPPTGTGLAEWATVTSMNSRDMEGDPFQCGCTACRNFWMKHLGVENAELLAGGTVNRSRSTGAMFYVKHLEVKVGDRVLVWREYKGVVKYIGPLADDLVSPHLFIGVQLDDNIDSLSSGMYEGKHYFNCPPGHGVFVRYKDIIVSEPSAKVPSLTGHEMFPSHKKIVSERRYKRERDPTYDLGLTLREKKGQTPELSQALPTSRKVASDRVIYDHMDTAYKDYIRYVNRPPPPPKTKVKLTDREKRNLELKKEFGGGERADKMIETVDRLREAFKEGLEVKQEEDDDYSS